MKKKVALIYFDSAINGGEIPCFVMEDGSRKVPIVLGSATFWVAPERRSELVSSYDEKWAQRNKKKWYQFWK